MTFLTSITQWSLPAIQQPDLYRNWTFTSGRTMTFQDTPCFAFAFNELRFAEINQFQLPTIERYKSLQSLSIR